MFLHFLICLMMVYGPFFILYRSSKLSEESRALPPTIQAGIGFGVTQIVKFFLLATFVPSISSFSSPVAVSVSTTTASAFFPSSFSISHELTQIFFHALDLIGLQILFTSTPQISKLSSAPLRILAIGLGWSAAESIALFLVPLWGATGVEVGATYVELSVQANLHLLINLIWVAMVWLRMRNDMPRALVLPVYLQLILVLILPTVFNFLHTEAALPHFVFYAIQVATVAVLGIITRSFLSSYQQRSAKLK